MDPTERAALLRGRAAAHRLAAGMYDLAASFELAAVAVRRVVEGYAVHEAVELMQRGPAESSEGC